MFRSNRFMLTAAIAVSIVGATPAAAAAADTAELTGSAYSLSAQANLLLNPLLKIDPVPQVAYPEGDSKSLAELGPDVAGLVSAKVLNASSDVSEGVLQSKASIAEAAVNGILRAEAVSAECEAAEGANPRGSSEVVELEVLGETIDTDISGPIEIPGVGTVTFNEQIRQGDTLIVNAVHVVIDGPINDVLSADIVLSQVRCSAGRDTETTPPTTPVPTTTTTPTTTEPPATTEPSEPGTTSQVPGPGDDGQRRDVAPAANDGDLAETGATGILPTLLVGALLLAGGVFALLRARRSRSAATGSPDSQS